MKNAFIFTTLLLASSSMYASCYGTGNIYTCNDNSGNSYNVQKFGNTTQVQGYNPNTGSSWNQTSQTYGNTTYSNGTASNGNMWNQTTIRNGSVGTTTFGTDSEGNAFNKSCNQFGCY